jgi:acetyl esterase/lipase
MASLVDYGAELLNVASRLGSGRVDRDVPYGSHERSRLDIYHPKERRPASPTLLFFYGGAWIKGSRQMYEFVGRAFARRGFDTVIPDYRLRGQGDAVAALVDCAAAVAFMHEYNDARLVLIGHSAGAQLAGSLAYSSKWAVPGGVAGFVGLAGPYSYIGDIRKAPVPPALLLSAETDRLVQATEAEQFGVRIRQRGGAAEVLRYERASHATLVGAISPLLRSVGPVARDIEAFILSLS